LSTEASAAGQGFSKILVANRGEIAVRVIRACRERGIATVAVFSDADRAALHVRLADEARRIGPPPSRQSYLRIDAVLDAAEATGAQAIHPGYGFLSENAAFARACEERGLVFIGPRSETIALMGEKTAARREAVAAGVPVVPGSLEPLADEAAIGREADRIGFPIMLKAAAGGGGKGLRRVESPDELLSALARARSEAAGAFGDDRVYIEKALVRPRHIEIQVLADTHGNVVHLFERECSIQRRHQKVIEESPSPLVTPELREQMGSLAVALARRVGYVNAGTLEFLVDAERQPYFLEMNTRLQVEHAVTEEVTGVDIVQAQIRIAQGEVLPWTQDELTLRGHAIECRVYAEDPRSGFLPSPGRIQALRTPDGPGVRDDSGVYSGWEVPVHYDPLISKLIVRAESREAAIRRMRRAVAEYRVRGIETTLPFFERVLRHPSFVAGEFDTSFVDTVLAEAPPSRPEEVRVAVLASAIQALRERQASRLQPSAAPRRSAWWDAGLREAHGRRGS
jgi:acetyl-CoA carboxylase biotin carboxylase subunit